MKRKDACAHQWVKGTPAFQIAEDERKKERLEHRASVDLSHMKECIERIWRLVRTFTGGASDICGIAAGPIPVLGGGKRRRERWRGPKAECGKLITLRIPYIGRCRNWTAL
jgi:hypothetical protein